MIETSITFEVVKECELGCGACCYGKRIAITLEELEQIVEKTGLQPSQFAKIEYVGPVPQIIIRNKKNGACYFLDEKTKKCTIHDIKPAQCKTYPLLFIEGYEKMAEDLGDSFLFTCEKGIAQYKISKKAFYEGVREREEELTKEYLIAALRKREIEKMFRRSKKR